MEFKPGSVIRIGRIKRGNTFSISEDAISTKHLERVESDVNRDGNTAGVKVGSGVEDNGPNLEKMTLGEWFDFLEVYLPKLIAEATEETIEGMRRKAERLHDYMRQQKRQRKMEKVEDVKVSSLILESRPAWDMVKLIKLFLPIDIEAVLSIPIGFNRSSDHLMWHFDKKGLSGLGMISCFDAIRLACKLGEVKEAVDVWNEMEASGFSAGIDSFVVMIHGFLEQGCLVEACESFKEMVGRVLLSAPQYGTLKELLNSLLRAEKLELAKRCLELYFD
ncbi:hypothetical protein QYF36_004902 [Acer negundo]|nr:hypothetical protein QYF36_004902 [Acer negundo]